MKTPEGSEMQGLGEEYNRVKLTDLNREDFMRLWFESRNKVHGLETKLAEKDLSAAIYAAQVTVEMARLRGDNSDWAAYAGYQAHMINNQAEITVGKNEVIADQRQMITDQGQIIIGQDRIIEARDRRIKFLQRQILRADWLADRKRIREAKQKEASISHRFAKGAERSLDRVGYMVGKVVQAMSETPVYDPVLGINHPLISPNTDK